MRFVRECHCLIGTSVDAEYPKSLLCINLDMYGDVVGYGSWVDGSEIWAWVIRSCGHALLKICEISPSVVLHPTILYLNIATLSSLFEGVGIQFMPTVSTALTVETVLTLMAVRQFSANGQQI